MKVQCIILCILASGIHATKHEVTPVQKVLQLMQGMLEKGKAAKHEEQVAYASKAEFCTNTKEAKAAAISTEGQNMAQFKTAIETAGVKLGELAKELAALQKNMDTWKGDIGASTKVRAIEKSDYDEKHKAQSEAIESMDRAVATLKKDTADKKQAPSLLQLSSFSSLTESALIPASAKKAITLFLQRGVDDDLALLDQTDEAAPEANAYENQSGGIIEMLEKMQDKFIAERTNLEKEEVTTKQAFAMFVQDLENQISQAGEDTTEKTVTKTKTQQLKAQKTDDLKEETKSYNDDTKFLNDLTADCTIKQNDFVARQQLRTDELTAINKAVSIIGGSAVKGSGEKHLPKGSLIQIKHASFGQLRSEISLNLQMQSRMVSFLHARAAKYNSRVLEAVAVHAGADPMKKVKKMIKDMIVKLLNEANKEAGHKGFCDKELAVNKHTRDRKTNQVETMTAEVDQLTAKIAKTAEEISDLEAAIAGLDAAIAKETEERSQEKAKNKDTTSDAKNAQEAVAQALTVLKEFYAKAATATQFLQVGAAGAEPYNGMGGESGGVVAMLEVIQEDFAKLEAETKAAEDTSQNEFEKFMEESRMDKADKSATSTHKKSANADSKTTLQTTQNDLEGTQAELTAALRTFDKLKPSCVDAGVSYEDRVKRREEEIESLKEALKILTGE